ncbi:MAG: AAA family ATPase [Candidatus Omnitrophota bacterium]
MFKRLLTYLIIAVFLSNQFAWAHPEAHSLRPKASAYNIQQILNNPHLNNAQKDPIHQKYIDIPLTNFYKECKVRALSENKQVMDNEISLALKYLFDKSGLGLKNKNIEDIVTLLFKYGYAKAVYVTKEEWPVKGHASNYGDKNLELNIRMYDNEDIAGTFLHELGALLGKKHKFNELLADDFRRWKNTGRSFNKKRLVKELKKAELCTNLKELLWRDFAWCWGKDLPEPEAFEEIKEDYSEAEGEIVKDTLDELEENGDIDEETREEIEDNLKENLNEDIIRDKLLPEANEGKLDDLDEDGLLDIFISRLIARLSTDFNIKISKEKFRELLKNKESLRKFLETFRKKVIEKIKKDKDKKGGGKNTKGGGKTITISVDAFKNRGVPSYNNQQNFKREGLRHPERSEGSGIYRFFGLYTQNDISVILNKVKDLFPLRFFVATLLRMTKEQFVQALAIFKKLSKLRIKVVELLPAGDFSVFGALKFPFIYFADDTNSGTPAVPQPPQATPGFPPGLVFSQQINSKDLYIDMLEEARAGAYNEIFIGDREAKTIGNIIERVTLPEKPGFFLVGPPGVGKTVLIQGLARMMVKGETESWLDDINPKRRKDVARVRLLQIVPERLLGPNNIVDMGKLDALLKDVADGRTICYIDEAQIFAQQPQGATAFFEYVKRLSTDGSFRLGLATTYEEKDLFFKNKAMLERYETIEHREPTEAETLELLENVAPSLLEKENPPEIPKNKHIYIPQEKLSHFLKTAITLSKRFIKLGFPRGPRDAVVMTLHHIRLREGSNKRDMKRFLTAAVKAVNSLAALRRSKKEREDLSERRQREVNKIVNNVNSLQKVYEKRKKQTSFEPIPSDIIIANKLEAGSQYMDENNWILSITDKLGSRIHGQPHAVKAVADRVIIDRKGRKPEKQPAGVYYCAGTTSVGKSALPKELARQLYPGDPKAFIKENMAHYSMPGTEWDLVGSTRGFVGSENGSDFLNAVRKRPHCVILLDEVDKIQNEVIWNMLLEIIDEGTYRGVDFTKAHIFFTSNEGLVMDDYRKSPEEIKDKVIKSIEKHKPEFLSRLKSKGKILIFNLLSEPTMLKIIQENFIKDVRVDFQENLGIEIELQEGKEDFRKTEESFVNVKGPFVVTDNDVIVSCDSATGTLKMSAKSEEFVIGQKASAQTEENGLAQKEIKFEKAVLSEPAMIRLIYNEDGIYRYLVADRESGIIVFDKDGKCSDVIGEATDFIEISGDKIYFYSLEDKHIKVVDFSGKEVNDYNQPLPDLKAMAVVPDPGKPGTVAVVCGSEKVLFLDSEGGIEKEVHIEHSEDMKKSAPDIEQHLRALLKNYGSFDKRLAKDMRGNKYWLEDGTVFIQRKNEENPSSFELAERSFGFNQNQAAGSLRINSITFDKLGFFYVYDSKENVIIKFSNRGKKVKQSTPLTNVIEDIVDIFIGNDGILYLLDSTDNCVYMFNKKIEILCETSTTGVTQNPKAKTIELDKLTEAKVNFDNLRIVAADKGNVYLFDTEQMVMFEVSRDGKKLNQLKADDVKAPSLVAISNYRDKLIASDTRANIFVLNKKGEVLKELPTLNKTGNYQLFCSNGNVVLGAEGHQNMVVFSDIKISPVVQLIMEKGFSKEGGARGIEGEGTSLLTDPLNLYYANGHITKGDKVKVERDGEKLRFKRTGKRKDPNPQAILTQITAGDDEFNRILMEIEEQIGLLMKEEGAEFTEEMLIRILDFKPINLIETDAFKPRKEYVIEGEKSVKNDALTLDTNLLTERNHKPFTAKTKWLLKNDDPLSKKVSKLIRCLTDLGKNYNLDAVMPEVTSEYKTFAELKSELRETIADKEALEGDDGDNEKQRLEEEEQKLAQIIEQVIEKADAEQKPVELSFNVSDKGEVIIACKIAKPPSLEEEEALIEALNYQPEAGMDLDAKFPDETTRALAKARYEFLGLPETIIGYHKTKDGELVIWFKLKKDIGELDLSDPVPVPVGGDNGSSEETPNIGDDLNASTSIGSKKRLFVKSATVLGENTLVGDFRAVLFDLKDDCFFIEEKVNGREITRGTSQGYELKNIVKKINAKTFEEIPLANEIVVDLCGNRYALYKDWLIVGYPSPETLSIKIFDKRTGRDVSDYISVQDWGLKNVKDMKFCGDFLYVLGDVFLPNGSKMLVRRFEFSIEQKKDLMAGLKIYRYKDIGLGIVSERADAIEIDDVNNRIFVRDREKQEIIVLDEVNNETIVLENKMNIIIDNSTFSLGRLPQMLLIEGALFSIENGLRLKAFYSNTGQELNCGFGPFCSISAVNNILYAVKPLWEDRQSAGISCIEIGIKQESPLPKERLYVKNETVLGKDTLVGDFRAVTYDPDEGCYYVDEVKLEKRFLRGGPITAWIHTIKKINAETREEIPLQFPISFVQDVPENRLAVCGNGLAVLGSVAGAFKYVSVYDKKTGQRIFRKRFANHIVDMKICGNYLYLLFNAMKIKGEVDVFLMNRDKEMELDLIFEYAIGAENLSDDLSFMAVDSVSEKIYVGDKGKGEIVILSEETKDVVDLENPIKLMDDLEGERGNAVMLGSWLIYAWDEYMRPRFYNTKTGQSITSDEERQAIGLSFISSFFDMGTYNNMFYKISPTTIEGSVCTTRGIQLVEFSTGEERVAKQEGGVDLEDKGLLGQGRLNGLFNDMVIDEETDSIIAVTKKPKASSSGVADKSSSTGIIELEGDSFEQNITIINKNIGNIKLQLPVVINGNDKVNVAIYKNWILVGAPSLQGVWVFDKRTGNVCPTLEVGSGKDTRIKGLRIVDDFLYVTDDFCFSDERNLEPKGGVWRIRLAVDEDNPSQKTLTWIARSCYLEGTLSGNLGDIEIDAGSNTLIICDHGSQKIVLVNEDTEEEIVLEKPIQIEASSFETVKLRLWKGLLVVCDARNVLRFIDLNTGKDLCSERKTKGFCGLAISGDTLYAADNGDRGIRKYDLKMAEKKSEEPIVPNDGTDWPILIGAGDRQKPFGFGSLSEGIRGIAHDDETDRFFIADTENNMIKVLDGQTGEEVWLQYNINLPRYNMNVSRPGDVRIYKKWVLCIDLVDDSIKIFNKKTGKEGKPMKFGLAKGLVSMDIKGDELYLLANDVNDNEGSIKKILIYGVKMISNARIGFNYLRTISKDKISNKASSVTVDEDTDQVFVIDNEFNNMIILDENGEIVKSPVASFFATDGVIWKDWYIFIENSDKTRSRLIFVNKETGKTNVVFTDYANLQGLTVVGSKLYATNASPVEGWINEFELQIENFADQNSYDAEAGGSKASASGSVQDLFNESQSFAQIKMSA